MAILSYVGELERPLRRLNTTLKAISLLARLKPFMHTQQQRLSAGTGACITLIQAPVRSPGKNLMTTTKSQTVHPAASRWDIPKPQGTKNNATLRIGVNTISKKQLSHSVAFRIISGRYHIFQIVLRTVMINCQERIRHT